MRKKPLQTRNERDQQRSRSNLQRIRQLPKQLAHQPPRIRQSNDSNRLGRHRRQIRIHIHPVQL